MTHPSGRSFILAIDQGTTGTRALLINHQAAIVASAYEPLRQYYPRPGWVEHDADEILAAVRTTIRRVLQKQGIPSKAITAMGLTNQRETFLLWDRRTGKAQGRAIVWQCRRSSTLCESLKRQGLEPTIQERTGLVLDPYFSGTKLRWIFESHPNLLSRARQGNILFGTIDSWLLWNLTGGAVHATDPTNASRTLLFNLKRRNWDDELLKILRIPSKILPDIRPTASDFGKTVRWGSLDAGIMIGSLCGDQQASLFGHGCFKPNKLKNTYGTGCFLLINTGQKIVRSRSGLLTTIVCDSRGRPAYGLEGSVFIAGAAVQWLRDGLGIIRRASETEMLAKSVPDSGGVTVVPAFTGLGAPYWDSRARGAILGITRGTRRAHLVRAALESIAFQTKDIADAMAQDTGNPLEELHVDGGACENKFLMQFQSDLLGIPIIRPHILDMTALGTGLLAGVAAEFWNQSIEALSTRSPEKIFRPQMKKGERLQHDARWKHAVSKVLELTVRAKR